MHIFSKNLLLLFVIFSVCSEDNDYCSKEDEICLTNSKLQRNDFVSKINYLDKRFLSQVNNSLSSYEECHSTKCGCFLQTLVSDLIPFKSGITKIMIENIRMKGTTYVIYEHKLYRSKDCLFPARCSGIEHFLLQLVKKLNNTELIINTRDWPQINTHFELFGPMLSFSKTNSYADILYPAWSFWEGGPAISLYPTGLGRWDTQRKLLADEYLKWPWEKKMANGFFRGSRTSEERDALILLSRKHPELVDAQYTKNQAWKSSADTLGAEPAKEVSLEYHCRYKYLFNYRGIAASFRFKHLFLCGSLVVHVGDEWYEFFYPALKPWVHYIPLSNDANENQILDLLSFFQRHDDVVREIAGKGRKFVQDHLSLKEVKCYWRNLLREYGKLLRFSVELDGSLIQIK